MKKTILLSLISTIFIGCSSTNALKYFQKDTSEARAIQYTKKVDLVQENEVKVLFWAAYLNNIDKIYNNLKEEQFIISLHFTNKTSQKIEENGYFLTLNNKKPFDIKLIDKNDTKYKAFTKNNKWANHYLVKFNTVKKSNNLNLKLQDKKTNFVELNFEK